MFFNPHCDCKLIIWKGNDDNGDDDDDDDGLDEQATVLSAFHYFAGKWDVKIPIYVAVRTLYLFFFFFNRPYHGFRRHFDE